MPVDPHLLEDLEWRGLIAHATDRDALREALTSGSVHFYVGFDPTAPSLHLGNLVQILTARRLQEAGHTPFALVGGATGMIGDPRDSGERALNPAETVTAWVERVRSQIEPFLTFTGDNAATMVNNIDWTAGLSVIDFLRDIGKHFPVNRMLARDVVRTRLEDGISYTEFSYVLLQSMDFLSLFREHGVTLQFGGSDQWGNLTGGVELVRRAEGGRVHAFATPLITKSDGTKYGKTEGGALWLDPEMMSPYAFFQFWLNVEDEKVGELLRIFTFLPRARDRGDRGASTPRSRSCGRGSVPSPRRSPRWCTAPPRPSGSRPRRPRSSGAVTSPASAPRPSVPPWRRPAPSRSRGRRVAERGRPAGADLPGLEPQRGATDRRRGRRVPEQPPGRGPRAGAGGVRPDRGALAGAAPGQEAVRRSGGRLR